MGILSNFGDNIGTSYTSYVEKAVLCIKKPRENDTLLNGKLSEKKAMDLLVNYTQAIGGTSSGQVFQNAATFEHKANSKNYHVFRVQYNPSSLQISTSASEVQKNNMPSSEGQKSDPVVVNASITQLSFQLIFDKTNTSDAFMSDRFQNTSLGGAVTAVSAMATDHSVKTEVEALIGALMHPESRNVLFFWNQMGFEGELTGVTAKYTMFNMRGNPIRATVDITIEQVGEDDLVDSKYWKNSFESFQILTANSVGNTEFLGDSALNPQKYVGNIFNLR